MAILNIRNLTVRFATATGSFTAVDGVDISVDRGEVLAIVGDESAAGSGDSGSDNGSSEKSGETKAEKVEDAATTATSSANRPTAVPSGRNFR